jgi:phage terminase small subunit
MVAEVSTIVELPGIAKRRRPRIPAPPAHITGLAAAEWRRAAKVLTERGDLDPAVLATLECYAVQYARWRDAEAHVAEFGAIVPAPRTGVPIPNPHLSVANRAGENLLKLAKALRITPDTRPSGLSGNQADDGWSGLLA